jgi:hypothetical protein
MTMAASGQVLPQHRHVKRASGVSSHAHARLHAVLPSRHGLRRDGCSAGRIRSLTKAVRFVDAESRKLVSGVTRCWRQCDAGCSHTGVALQMRDTRVEMLEMDNAVEDVVDDGGDDLYDIEADVGGKGKKPTRAPLTKRAKLAAASRCASPARVVSCTLVSPHLISCRVLS